MPRTDSLLARVTDHTQFRLTPSGPGRVLDVGCGADKYPGAVGVDVSAETAADVVLDLDDIPYEALQSSSFEQILCQDVLEHVESPMRVMEELHRIAAPGGRIHVRTPHFSSLLAYSDPTHRHYFSALAVRALAEPRFAHYAQVRMRVVHCTLEFWTPFRLTGVAWLANRHQTPYEKYLAFRFPAMNIHAEFEVLK
jgi:SAM-dependent methyltransferase